MLVPKSFWLKTFVDLAQDFSSIDVDGLTQLVLVASCSQRGGELPEVWLGRNFVRVGVVLKALSRRNFGSAVL